MIDKNLRDDGEKASREVKLLLLGEFSRSGDGKSRKYMHFTTREIRYQLFLYLNTL